MKPKVLVVEDERAISEPLAEHLVREGFDAQVAATIEDATTALEASAPDLILLDVMLPDGDGRDLCRRIRTSSDVPIIMLTARGEEIDRIAGLELDRLERTVQAQREFVANASHQLRTPLTGMKLRLESAMEQAPTEDLKEQLRAADQEVDRLASTVDRLLVMARRLEEGEPTEVELRAAAERAEERWRDCELHTGTADGRAFLAVRDHGAGIAPGERSKVTERFFRGSTAPPGGSGLGLA